jgi:hypothetical protein
MPLELRLDRGSEVVLLTRRTPKLRPEPPPFPLMPPRFPTFLLACETHFCYRRNGVPEFCSAIISRVGVL